MSTPATGSTTLLFQAPPAAPADDPTAADESTVSAPTSRSSRAGRAGARGLRMLKGARQAATGMKLSDEQIRAVLEDPQDVEPDPSQPHRTRLTRDGITVTTGQDGMILRVTRRR